MDLPRAFRAGRRPGERAGTAPAVGIAAAGPAVFLADVSEFEPDVADAAYLAWSQAIVIRAAYGDQHDDRAWYGGARRDLLHAGGARFLGIYQYLVAGQDGAEQARAFRSLVGAIRPGEVFIADFEEGAKPVLAAWRAEMGALYGAEIGPYLWTYSGLYFGQAAGLGSWQWVAAYGTAEPLVRHELWQFTDAYLVPGVGSCDCSVFHGTIDQLAATAYGGQLVPVPPPPAPPPASSWTEHLMTELATLAYGASGEDVKTAQGLLGARGYPVVIDGSYGPATRAAVTAFQHAAGITADGVTGPVTWLRLHARTA